ncbi:MAG: integrase arm-type DNA-binding domain-containing protein [Burkholderiales bacterium]|nr:integrase arm-type DNA-binding domain-containing protein [Burkholderiales bacterium]MBK8666844.1 integrase arm-type DNA-binding domain-containing protein [Burkholderiales bacterium]
MLTDAAIKRANCPPDKARARFADSGGLYLEVAAAGSKRWFWKFRIEGKEKRIALGSYPEVSLKDARVARDDARKLQRDGIDPVRQRRVDKLDNLSAGDATFEAVAREFHTTHKSGWSPHYAKRWLERLEKDLFPFIGPVQLTAIKAPLLLHALKRVEQRGALETAHSLRQYAGQVFRHGIATGRCEVNPVPDLRTALKPVHVKHMAAVLDAGSVGKLMRDIYAYEGQPVTRAALIFSALTFQRPGNVRATEWSEVDLDAGMWTIPAMKMKRTVHQKVNGRPHFVPLAPQAVEVLRELWPLTGHGKFVFPSLLGKGRCMSENTVRGALRRLGYGNDEMTPHGFRAVARTLMVEQLDVNPDVIEAQLAHGKSGPLGMAYDRAQYMAQRRDMMGKWADYLDKLRVGAAVIKLRA